MRTIERVLLAAICVLLVLAVSAIGARLGGVAVLLFLVILAALAFLTTAVWMGCHEPIQRFAARRRETKRLAGEIDAGHRGGPAIDRPREDGQCARLIAAMHGTDRKTTRDPVIEAMHGPTTNANGAGQPVPEPTRAETGPSPADLKGILSRGKPTPVGNDEDVRRCAEQLRGPGGAILRAYYDRNGRKFARISQDKD